MTIQLAVYKTVRNTWRMACQKSDCFMAATPERSDRAGVEREAVDHMRRYHYGHAYQFVDDNGDPCSEVMGEPEPEPGDATLMRLVERMNSAHNELLDYLNRRDKSLAEERATHDAKLRLSVLAEVVELINNARGDDDETF